MSSVQATQSSLPTSATTAGLPKIIVIATGGTIAGSSPSSTDTTDYVAGKVSGQDLVLAVPEISSVANVEVVQFSNFASTEITRALLLDLSRKVSGYLLDETVSGVVITHGTSTTEETALFMELTVDSDKPVIVVGAMRPGTALSADGPLNLLQAISLAAHPLANGRGTMVVSNDRICSAMYTAKSHTQAVDAFRAYEVGYLGVFVGITPRFYFGPAKVPGMPKFDIRNTVSLPRVDILYSYQDEDPSFIDYAISVGAKGIVVAGTGNSTVSKTMEARIIAAMSSGTPVVRATRVSAGFVSAKAEGIASGFYSAAHARILLMLAIESGADMERIAAYFIAA